MSEDENRNDGAGRDAGEPGVRTQLQRALRTIQGEVGEAPAQTAGAGMRTAGDAGDDARTTLIAHKDAGAASDASAGAGGDVTAPASPASAAATPPPAGAPAAASGQGQGAPGEGGAPGAGAASDPVPPTRIMRPGPGAGAAGGGRTRLVRGPLKVSRSEFHQDPVVGWLVVIGGPGLGAFRPIFEGNNTIGRAPSQRIPIDFGDDTISAEEQAYIRYDAAERRFLFVPNLAKTNVVSVNEDKPTSAVPLQAMDVITMGHTQLVFVPFCGEEFDWSELTAL